MVPPLTERVKLRLEAQFFNVFNHPNFGLPSMVLAGIPGKHSTQTVFGSLTYTTPPPTGLLGVGLGGDNSPRVIAFQLRWSFRVLIARCLRAPRTLGPPGAAEVDDNQRSRSQLEQNVLPHYLL